MIDEFQDTNPAQWALARCLMKTGEQAGPELFIVGDVKQSIYRFRNADVTVFLEAQAKTAKTILLNRNFRTLPNVMDSINTFFADSGLLKNVVEPWESLEAHRPRADRVRFEFLLNTMPGKANVVQQRQAEAGRIADHVAVMCSEEFEYRIQKEDAESGEVGLHMVEYRDIALLFRTKKNMYLYENAMKKYGIPYVTLGGNQFFYRQEIADLTNLLRAIVDPWDEHALLGFLRSPIVGLSDNSIVRLGWRKGLAEEFRGDASLEDDEQNERLISAREWMREFCEHASVPISELLQRIIVRTNYEAILLGLPHGEQRRSNVRKMQDTAREMTVSGKGSLTEFVNHLEEQISPGVLEGDAPLMGEQQNAVTLMTIHGSKGLEFPVVILPDTSTPPKTGSSGHHVASHKDLGFVAKAPSVEKNDLKPAIFSLVNATNKEEDLAEDARVLYVAMTRARDYLVVSGTVLEKEKKKKKGEEEADTELVIAKNSWLAHFDSVFALRRVLEGEEVREGISVLSEAHTGRSAKGLLEDSVSPISIGVAQIGVIEISDGDREFVSTTAWLDARYPGPEGLARDFDLAQQTALVRGTMVHRYLEAWDFSGEDAPDVEAFFGKEYPAYAGDGEWVAYLEGIAGRLRESEIYSVLREGGALRRELPFMVSIGAQWISGTVDVLTGAGVIVDYKTGKYREESVGRYEMQLRLYAHALGELSGKAVEKALLYFVDEGRVHEVDLGVGMEF
jgi:ATP-dependent helicase/nuclease subunit A